MVCFCCKEARLTVKDRKPGSQSATRLICDECWDDPEPAYANCKHGKGDAMKIGDNGLSGAKLSRLIDDATEEMDAKGRAIFRSGVSLGLTVALRNMEEVILEMKNAAPTILERPTTVRRIGLI